MAVIDLCLTENQQWSFPHEDVSARAGGVAGDLRTRVCYITQETGRNHIRPFLSRNKMGDLSLHPDRGLWN